MLKCKLWSHACLCIPSTAHLPCIHWSRSMVLSIMQFLWICFVEVMVKKRDTASLLLLPVWLCCPHRSCLIVFQKCEHFSCAVKYLDHSRTHCQVWRPCCVSMRHLRRLWLHKLGVWRNWSSSQLSCWPITIMILQESHNVCRQSVPAGTGSRRVPWHGADACKNHTSCSSSCVTCMRCVFQDDLSCDLAERERECVHAVCQRKLCAASSL